MPLLIVAIAVAVVYVGFGMMYTTRLIIGYRRNFTPAERAMQQDCDGDNWKTAVSSFFVTTLTWPVAMRYIARETRSALQLQAFEHDRAERVYGYGW